MAPRFVNPGYERAYRITYEFAEGNADTNWPAGCTPRAGPRFARALYMHDIARILVRKAGSIAANERGAFDTGGRAATDP